MFCSRNVCSVASTPALRFFFQIVVALRRRALEFSSHVAALRPSAKLCANTCLTPTLTLTLIFLAACGHDVSSRLQTVSSLQGEGKFQESIEPLREILKSVPEHPEANYLLGLALIQTRQPGLAVWPLEKALTDPEHTVAVGITLSSVYLETQNFNEALRVVDLVLEKDPKNATALFTRARTNLVATSYAEALADAERILAITPDHYAALLIKGEALFYLKRLADAEATFQRVRNLSKAYSEPGPALGWIELAKFYEISDNQPALERELEAMLKAYPTDLAILNFASKHFDATNRSEEINRLWKTAIQAKPNQTALSLTFAKRLREQNNFDEAQAIYAETATKNNTAETWLRLAEFYKMRGNGTLALQAMNHGVELTPTKSPELLFEQADIYIDARDFKGARALIGKIDSSLYRSLLEGRILLLEGNPKAALEKFDVGVREWPNNASARFLAGKAAFDLGLYERAASELRESYRSEPGKTDAAAVLAELNFAQGNYGAAIEFAGYHLKNRDLQHLRPKDQDAIWILVRSLAALGSFEQAEKVVRTHEAQFTDPVRTTLEKVSLAQRKAKTTGEVPSKAAIRILKSVQSELLAPEEEPLLAAYIDNLLLTGQNDLALERVNRAITARAESGTLYDLKGRVLGNLNQLDAAQAAFEKAIALDPKAARPLEGLATLAIKNNQYDRALEFFKKASERDPQRADYLYRQAQLYILKNEHKKAITLLREVVRRDIAHASARNDLAWLLADSGQELDSAVALAKEAAKIEATPEILDTLGWAFFKSGDHANAEKAYRNALKLAPQMASTHYRLGLTLMELGRKELALVEFRTALAGENFPEAPQAKALIATLEKEKL